MKIIICSYIPGQWEDFMGLFKSAASSAFDFLTQVTTWIFGNPFLMILFSISVISGVLYLIKAAKDSVQ